MCSSPLGQRFLAWFYLGQPMNQSMNRLVQKVPLFQHTQEPPNPLYVDEDFDTFVTVDNRGSLLVLQKVI